VNAADCVAAQVQGTDVFIVAIHFPGKDALPGFTDIARRTGIAIVTKGSVHRFMKAPDDLLARVYCAGIQITAIHGEPGAVPLDAHVGRGAVVAIVACLAHRVRNTIPGIRVAEIIGAFVSIVANNRDSRNAHPVGTPIAECAGILVAARDVQVLEDAAGERMAGCRRTGIAVITEYREAVAFAGLAQVSVRARVPVIARGHVRREHAPSLLLDAKVVRAGVGVVALNHSAHAENALALVVHSAGASVVALSNHRLVNAPGVRLARVFCTDIGILTVLWLPDAHAVQAVVLHRAWIVVVAGTGNHGERAFARFRVAHAVCARIAVFTGDWNPQAVAPLAPISDGTLVAVIAGQLVRRVEATCQRDALVVRAGVAIVATHFGQSETRTLLALVVRGAEIAVIAFRAVGKAGEQTLARIRRANGLLALRVKHVCALDYRVGMYVAVMRPRVLVAKQHSVALVAVLEGEAIGVVEALALVQTAGLAQAPLAVVSGRTLVAVIAGSVHRFVHALAAGRATVVESAFVPVVAREGRAPRLAGAVDAHIPHGTGIPVITSYGDGNVKAP